MRKFKHSEYLDTLDFEVVKEPLFYGADKTPFSNRVALVNTKLEKVLSVMSPSYRLFNNEEFMELSNKISESLGLKIDHYAVHGHGKRVLSAFRNNETKKILGYDFTSNIILFDARDGGNALTVGGNGWLHRCSNMFSSTEAMIKINHSSKLDEMVAEFELGLELYALNTEQKIKRLERLAEIPVTRENVYTLIGGWTKLKPEEVKAIATGADVPEVSVRKENIVNGIISSWDIEAGDLGHNGFGLLNAVTHYYTHTREKNETDLLFGDFGRKETATVRFAEALAN